MKASRDVHLRQDLLDAPLRGNALPKSAGDGDEVKTEVCRMDDDPHTMIDNSRRPPPSSACELGGLTPLNKTVTTH